MRTILLVVFIMLLTSFASAQQPGYNTVNTQPQTTTSGGGQRWAISIGVQLNLSYARADAEAIAQTLITHCGYPPSNVVVMTDSPELAQKHSADYATGANIRNRILQITQNAGDKDVLLIFYSGHGGRADDGSGYLVPADADSLGMLPIAWVRNALERCAAQQRLLILDACHAGAKAAPPVNPREAILAELAKGAFLTLSSCDADQTSVEAPEYNQGVFTWALLAGLRGAADTEVQGNRDGIITAYELHRFAVDRITEYCRPRPQVNMTPVLRGNSRGPVELVRFAGQIDVVDPIVGPAEIDTHEAVVGAWQTTTGGRGGSGDALARALVFVCEDEASIEEQIARYLENVHDFQDVERMVHTNIAGDMYLSTNVRFGVAPSLPVFVDSYKGTVNNGRTQTRAMRIYSYYVLPDAAKTAQARRTILRLNNKVHAETTWPTCFYIDKDGDVFMESWVTIPDPSVPVHAEMIHAAIYELARNWDLYWQQLRTRAPVQ